MIFQVVLIEDLEVKHRIFTGKKNKDEIFLLPCGTVLDVYSIYGDSSPRGYGYELIPSFIFFHKSLPCFSLCDVKICRPAI